MAVIVEPGVPMNTTFIKRDGQKIMAAGANGSNKNKGGLPPWATEVAALLSPKAENDWKLVAQKLGYSKTFIRAWGTRPNPALDMLSQYFATNKPKDATDYLVNVCVKIDRQDVVVAIAKYEHSVRNSPATSPTRNSGSNDSHRNASDSNAENQSPAVFLSYQWAHQKLIKYLKSRLEEEGISCWIDVEQMAGGDSLYEEIDKGIRSSSVVVLCINEKYVSSANCQREVNLSNGLGKPMIPIMLEKVEWPPKGSIGPIVANKSYLKFFLHNGEKPSSKDEFWPSGNFAKLVTKIRGHLSNVAEKSENGEDQKQPAKPILRKTEQRRSSLGNTGSPDTNKQQQTNNDRRRRVSFANVEEERESRASTPVDLEDRTKPSFNVIISCSPDKLFEMRSLEKHISNAGFTTKVMPYTENSIARIDSSHVIFAWSVKYSKSPMAVGELNKALDGGRNIIVLLLDPVEFPPSNSSDAKEKASTVDCRKLKARAAWDGTDQLTQVLAALGSPNDGMQNSRTGSASSTGSATFTKAPPPPASTPAVQIRVRPPTPDVRGRSNESNGKRKKDKVNHSLLHQDSMYEDDEDEEEGSSDDGSTSDALDTDQEEVLEMRNGYKLPPVNANSQSNNTQQRSPRGNGGGLSKSQPSTAKQGNSSGSSQPVIAPPRRAPSNLSKSVAKPARGRPPQQQQPEKDWDKKLPSVYRRKHVVAQAY